MNFFLLIYCFFIIYLIYLRNFRENFRYIPQPKCSFKASGKTKRDCLKNCGENNKCNNLQCQDICNSCNDYKICNWLNVPTCNYEPKGSKVYDCVDECIGPRKIQWGGDACIYSECKRICEGCKDENNCGWIAKLKKEQRCKFTPWGPDKQACIDRCSSDDRDAWGGDICSVNNCTNICDSCTNKEYCKWNKKEEVQEPTPVIGLPPKQEIKLIPGNSKILIQWMPKHDSDNPNNGYLLYYYKSSMPISGVKIKQINEMNKTFCEYMLENLDNDNNYSVILIAYNKLGKGKFSEIVDATPRDNINLIYDEE